MKAEVLNEHIECTSELLMNPWWNLKHVAGLKAKVVDLVEGMKKYLDYMKRTSDAMLQHHKKTGMCFR